jgi:hypothetical protein
MSRLLIAIALVLSFHTAGAVRVLEQIERAVELTLGGIITLPTSEDGTVSFHDCPTCGISTHRVTAGTVYQASGQSLSLVDFVRVTEQLSSQPGKDDSVIVTVFLDIASGRVTRLTLLD